MYSLHIHDHAEQDLEAIAQRDADAADFLVAFLEELGGDQRLLDRLSQHGYSVRDGGDWAANFDVSVWAGQQNRRRNLWRLKSWEIEAGAHRVVYAFQPLINTYVVLGVFHRSEFNYEQDNPLTKRVLRDYDDL